MWTEVCNSSESMAEAFPANHRWQKGRAVKRRMPRYSPKTIPTTIRTILRTFLMASLRFVTAKVVFFYVVNKIVARLCMNVGLFSLILRSF